ncbi:3-oxoacyl-ACP reductase [Propionicimonas sp.]|uniref:3-oxoacyl-ACP reductase n=1 Tax=Propionicimonas sp. TaxID=1955623 RepID=UPI001E0EAEB3|nr:3-oxoacyl-ACP reductase [Propionicimonas sp.]MBU3976495.1 3-oxoacyl-ACP reductase [Actinomycetota bacterium]MBU3987327.1 3-oxoacyl-ACP reductase [Actinomycetota bacterium]MBU4007639.1 3-oxoacyl-ACP reductase [Actinomycetota bacterium]MBU4064420.1 3-oxoacyl-ACP reductase [Actinomycetota bacterium]MBU4092153.1 3-oxoacyl-ACP reductase [Actinomycetota bacterium]
MSVLEQLLYSAPGQLVAEKLGLPEPEVLRRGRKLPAGAVVTAALAGSTLATDTLALLGVPIDSALRDDGAEPPAYPERIGALVIDARGLRQLVELEGLRAVLRPAMKGLEASGRVVVLADAEVEGLEANAVRQGLDGINRTVGKELRHGATSNLIYCSPSITGAELASTMSFLLEGRSAFVDGQSWTVGSPLTPPGELATRPLLDRIVVVTGSARGIGARIAGVAARDGAKVVCVDVPAAGEALAAVANRLGGTALQLDITAAEAGERIAAHVASRYGEQARIHGLVHNAGITRDKLLANTDAARWGQVIEVNLAAQLRINPVLLDGRPGGLGDDARIVSIASTSGIAGNRGQANYAASKAGVVGLVRAFAAEVAERGITVNAVAPGFIETDMTAKIPFVQREVFRRTNSLGQGGDPIDVAETIGYFLDPASAGVSGQVIRVCGQNLVGA